MLASDELSYLDRAIALALSAEKEGNLPIGAVIALDGQILGEGGNRIASLITIQAAMRRSKPCAASHQKLGIGRQR